MRFNPQGYTNCDEAIAETRSEYLKLLATVKVPQHRTSVASLTALHRSFQDACRQDSTMSKAIQQGAFLRLGTILVKLSKLRVTLNTECVRSAPNRTRDIVLSHYS